MPRDFWAPLTLVACIAFSHFIIKIGISACNLKIVIETEFSFQFYATCLYFSDLNAESLVDRISGCDIPLCQVKGRQGNEMIGAGGLIFDAHLILLAFHGFKW